jgi:hypothetical protein
MIDIDIHLLKEFENQLNTNDPEGGTIPVKILGYGEMSAIFLFEGMPETAIKRMPPFHSAQEVSAYKSNIDEYCGFLTDKFNMNIAEYAYVEIVNKYDEHILYVAQNKLDVKFIGNRLIQSCKDEELEKILKAIMNKLIPIWKWNAQNEDMIFGLDSQISNWCFEPGKDGGLVPVYFDYTTPFIRKNGKELLDPEIFLKSCPSFLVWLVRWLFLHDVLDRYYNLRLVLIDITANFYKEGQAARTPFVIETINKYIAHNVSELEMEPIVQKEVDKYYKEDAFIWKLFLSLRRLDRFIKTKIFRDKYDFILPGKIKR